MSAETVGATTREAQQLEFLRSAHLAQFLSESSLNGKKLPAQISVEVLQHRPGAGISVMFAAANPVEHPSGVDGFQDAHPTDASESDSADGARDQEYFGLSTEPAALAAADDDTQASVIRLEHPLGPFALWEHPLDPGLPGLALAARPSAVQQNWGAGRHLQRLVTLSYRPLRRAVIAAEFQDGRNLYLKTLRKKFAYPLYERHMMLREAGVPVPAPVSEPIDGVLALEQGHGQSLAENFMHDGAAAINPIVFVELLAKLPAEVMTLPAREAWADRLPDYVNAASLCLPEYEARIRRVGTYIRENLRHTDRGPVVPTHGDFYEANILMHQDKVSALLDVDALGPGHRVDDLACFLGHMAVLPAVDARYTEVPHAFERFARSFATAVDGEALRLRTAAVAVSLVAGAFQPRNPQWYQDALLRLACAESVLGLDTEPALGVDVPAYAGSADSTVPNRVLPRWPVQLSL